MPQHKVDIHILVDKKEIHALFQLIDDPDQEVYDLVSSKLLSCGKEIIPSLEHLWEHTVDDDAQERIINLIHKLHFNDLKTEFQTWCQSPRPELFRGAILIAKYQYPDLNIPFLLTQFEQIRKNIWLELNHYLTPIEKINTFNAILYNYYKLAGSELSDHKVDGFFINKVLESKQGNPITLGILYIVLAELLDIPIFALSIPQQFLLGYVESLQQFYTLDNTAKTKVSFFIDPINGMIYSQHEVDLYLFKLKKDPKDYRFYLPQDNKMVISRLLKELSRCLSANGDHERSLEVDSLLFELSTSQDDQE